MMSSDDPRVTTIVGVKPAAVAVSPVRKAAMMGLRAGRAFKSTGVPTRNPFVGQDALAKAWRRGYFKAQSKREIK